jgi:hypothetical protein
MAKALLPILTKEDLEAAKVACAASKDADRLAAAAKKKKEGALAQIFFTMGFSMDEVKSMDPMLLADTIERQVGRTFELERKAFAEFALAKTSQGKYPSWKNELLAINGPKVVAQIESETATQYSYTVIEAAASVPGVAGVFVLAPEPEVKSKRAAK